jgi:hypothetical protein
METLSYIIDLFAVFVEFFQIATGLPTLISWIILGIIGAVTTIAMMFVICGLICRAFIPVMMTLGVAGLVWTIFMICIYNS